VIVGSSSDAPDSAEAERLSRYEVARLCAPNASALTLSGTNTWIVGHRPAWVVDPGPLIDSHLERLFAAIEGREGLGGVALTHDHGDHSEAVATVLQRYPAPLAAGHREDARRLAAGVRFGPFEAVPTPGHSADHFALLARGACFTGDAVLGEGSVFIAPEAGAMSGYLLALERLRERGDIEVLCPGHGPPVWDPQSKLDEYIAHRLERERDLIGALSKGLRTTPELLDAVWVDVPTALRPLAAVTLAAHLEKLEEEGILPAEVERPKLEQIEW
jgi:glyoxylase-like metal-dependent hydrolase (beta-lactamase superfamily II)